MVDKLSISLVNQMVDGKLIEDEQKEHYLYALITMIERVISIGTIFVISIFVNKLVPTFLFLLFFLSLRKRTGGFHLNTFVQCYFATIGIYLLVLIIDPILVDNLQILLEVLLGAICAIEIIGTVNHPNMHLDNVELVNLSKSARILVILEGSVIYALALGNGNSLYVCYMSIAVILCAILQCLAKFMKQEAKRSEEAEKGVHRYR